MTSTHQIDEKLGDWFSRRVRRLVFKRQQSPDFAADRKAGLGEVRYISAEETKKQYGSLEAGPIKTPSMAFRFL